MTMLQVPVHPGEILKHEFLEPMGISAGKLARHIRVPRTRIERLSNEETSMTIDTARPGPAHVLPAGHPEVTLAPRSAAVLKMVGSIPPSRA